MIWGVLTSLMRFSHCCCYHQTFNQRDFRMSPNGPPDTRLSKGPNAKNLSTLHLLEPFLNLIQVRVHGLDETWALSPGPQSSDPYIVLDLEVRVLPGSKTGFHTHRPLQFGSQMSSCTWSVHGPGSQDPIHRLESEALKSIVDIDPLQCGPGLKVRTALTQPMRSLT